MYTQPRASIIIPAHNEAAVIGRTVGSLLQSAAPGEFDVLVVCNGCSDSTADAARALPFTDVRVLSIPQASKTHALNAGDEAARTYPRLYLDADVEITTDGARRMVEALQHADCAVATPHYRLEGCGPLARAYWIEWRRRNPALRVGTGCFGLSRSARASHTQFPDVIGDDIWIATQFSPVPVAGATTQVRVARTVPAILKRRMRVVRGNRQLHGKHPGAGGGVRPAPSALDPTRTRPHPAGVGVLVAVHWLASFWVRVRPTGGWGQDLTTRS